MASKTRRVLIGCGIGCGAFVLIGLISFISFIVWLGRPGEIPARDARFGPDTTAFIEWTMDLEDEGTAILVEEFLASMDSLNRRGMGNSQIGDLIANFQNRSSRKDMEKMFPMLLTWVHEPGDAGEDLVTVSSRGFGNQLRFYNWMFCRVIARDSPWIERRGKECIYHVQEDEGLVFSAAFSRRATAFIARDVGAAKRTMARLDETASDDSPSRVDAWLDRIPEGARIRGAILNVDGDLQRVWEDVVGPEASIDWERFEAIVVHGGFNETTDLLLDLDFVCRGGDCSGIDLTPLSESMRVSVGETNFEIGGAEDGPDDSLRIRLRIDDVAGQIARTFTDNLPIPEP